MIVMAKSITRKKIWATLLLFLIVGTISTTFNMFLLNFSSESSISYKDYNNKDTMLHMLYHNILNSVEDQI